MKRINVNKGSNTYERRGIELAWLPSLFLPNRLQCSFGNLLGVLALMVEFDKSQKVPGKADQNLKEINNMA